MDPFAIIKVDCLSDDKIIKETKHFNSAVKVTKLDSPKLLLELQSVQNIKYHVYLVLLTLLSKI